jgi:hypothetical protein
MGDWLRRSGHRRGYLVVPAEQDERCCPSRRGDGNLTGGYPAPQSDAYAHPDISPTNSYPRASDTYTYPTLEDGRQVGSSKAIGYPDRNPHAYADGNA